MNAIRVATLALIVALLFFTSIGYQAMSAQGLRPASPTEYVMGGERWTETVQ